MTKHISKKQQLEFLLNEIKSKTNKGNVDFILPLLEWTKDKIDLTILAESKKASAKELKKQGKRSPLPLQLSRGEIWQANLGHNIGSEQNGERPVLIIQNNNNNRKSPNTIIIPLSKIENRKDLNYIYTESELDKIEKTELRPTEVLLRMNDVAKNETLLAHPSIILCQNIKEISKERLSYKITSIDEKKWPAIHEAVKFSIQIE